MNQTKIYIEGNIGSGKSEFIRFLHELGFTVIQEPVKIWEEIGILVEFYKDPKRWAYTFQSLAFATRLSETCSTINNINNTNTIIMERSIYTDRNCFTELQVEFGNMTKMEYDTYLAWYNLMEIKFRDEIKADFIIYLRTTPEICYERIKKRSRNGESSIGMEYLRALHDKHEKWLSAGVEGTKIITVDVSQDMDEETHKKFTKQIINEILGPTNPDHA